MRKKTAILIRKYVQDLVSHDPKQFKPEYKAWKKMWGRMSHIEHSKHAEDMRRYINA